MDLFYCFVDHRIVIRIFLGITMPGYVTCDYEYVWRFSGNLLNETFCENLRRITVKPSQRRILIALFFRVNLLLSRAFLLAKACVVGQWIVTG